MLDTALELYFGILCFPFLLTVVEFNSDCRLDEITPIILPDAFQDQFVDLQLYDIFFCLLTDSRVPRCYSQTVVKICCRMPAVRNTISLEPQTYKGHIAFCLKTFTTMADRAIKDQCLETIDLLLDHCHRLFRTFAFDELQVDDLKDLFVSFLGHLGLLAESLIATNFELGSSRLDNMGQILTTILTQCVKQDNQLLEHILLAVVRRLILWLFDDRLSAPTFSPTLITADAKDIRTSLDQSLAVFEECYCYLDVARSLILNDLVMAFMTRLEVTSSHLDIHGLRGFPLQPRRLHSSHSQTWSDHGHLSRLHVFTQTR